MPRHHFSFGKRAGQGVMLLRLLGGERCRVLEARVVPDQRTEARIEMLKPDSDGPISKMHVSCAQALKIVIDDIEAKGEGETSLFFQQSICAPAPTRRCRMGHESLV
jgi:Lon protease-like protein